MSKMITFDGHTFRCLMATAETCDEASFMHVWRFLARQRRVRNVEATVQAWVAQYREHGMKSFDAREPFPYGNQEQL